MNHADFVDFIQFDSNYSILFNIFNITHMLKFYQNQLIFKILKIPVKSLGLLQKHFAWNQKSWLWPYLWNHFFKFKNLSLVCQNNSINAAYWCPRWKKKILQILWIDVHKRRSSMLYNRFGLMLWVEKIEVCFWWMPLYFRKIAISFTFLGKLNKWMKSGEVELQVNLVK